MHYDWPAGGLAVDNYTGSILVLNNPTYNLIFTGDADFERGKRLL